VGPVTQWRRFKHTNRSEPVTWEELHDIDSALTAEIRAYSERQGYPSTSKTNA
jgi:hypothetical protein